MKWVKIAENARYVFEIGKAGAGDWYVRAIDKASGERASLAGSTTRKAVVKCAEAWAGWMK